MNSTDYPQRPAALKTISDALVAKDSDDYGVYNVTMGEWFVSEPGSYHHDGLRKIEIMNQDGSKVCRLLLDVGLTRGKSEPEQLNAKFITACSPVNVTALLEYILELETHMKTLVPASSLGPRPAPEGNDDQLKWEHQRLAKAAKHNRPAYGLCPAGCGCFWRDNLDGSMSLGIGQRSCTKCEVLPFDKLIPLSAVPADIPFPECPICEENDQVHVRKSGALRCARCYGKESEE